MRIKSSSLVAGGIAGTAAAAIAPPRWMLRALLHLAPFAAAGVTYEGLRAAVRPPTSVHVADLFHLEQRLFSVPTPSGPRTLSELCASYTHPLLDLLCGVTYLLWVPQVLAFTLLLFLRTRHKGLELAFGFLLVNLLGWTIWVLFPAAPPWYVDQYGLGPLVSDAPASAAGLTRLDELLHLPIAASLYSKSAYTFGAMPSLHVAYAVLTASVAFSLGGRWRAVSLAMAFSMGFSAVYLRHHYVLDVIAGVVLALGVWCMMIVIMRGVSRYVRTS